MRSALHQQPLPRRKQARRPRRAGVRTFTVTRRYIEGRRPHQEGELVPLLRMSGHWLEQCGFDTGALVSVTAKQGRIVLALFRPAPAAMQQVSSRVAAARAPRVRGRPVSVCMRRLIA